MVPMRYSTIFKSRKMALVWAAGVIWFAISFTSPDDDAVTNATEAASANAAYAQLPEQDRQSVDTLAHFGD